MAFFFPKLCVLSKSIWDTEIFTSRLCMGGKKIVYLATRPNLRDHRVIKHILLKKIQASPRILHDGFIST